MALEQVKVRIEGVTYRGLIMHNNRGVNPRDPLTQKLHGLTSKRKKSDEDIDAIARTEWELGLYYDDKEGPILTPEMVHACLRDAGRKVKMGQTVLEAVYLDVPLIRLDYDGPRDIDGLYADGRFFDYRPAGVRGASVNRARPIFHQWAARFPITFEGEFINRDDVLNILEIAGRRIGLGDYRPTYGRFTVEETR